MLATAAIRREAALLAVVGLAMYVPMAMAGASVVRATSSTTTDPILGDWNITYGSPSVVTMTGSGGNYRVIAKSPVQVNGSSCFLPPSTLIATFSGSGTSYTGVHNLWYTSNCQLGGSIGMSLTLNGTTLTAVLDGGYGTVTYLLMSSPASRYAALGDSYQSGEGVPPFDTATDTKTNTCHRSTAAYAHLLEQAGVVPPSLDFVACSGATSGDVKAKQVGVLGSDVQLATVGAGGNDIGFADIFRACVTAIWTPCSQEWDPKTVPKLIALKSTIDPGGQIVPGPLASLYEQMKSAISPTGRVLVMGYPQIWPGDHPGCRGTPQFQNAGPFGGTDQLWMNQRLGELNAIIANEASIAGVEYVDVTAAFSGHELCSGNAAYMNGVDIGHQEYSFHPNADGQNAFYQAMAAYLAAHPTSSSMPAPRGPAASVGPHLPPVVNVSETPTAGVSPLTVNFDSSHTHDDGATITAWAWDFGDGTFGSGPTAAHTYTQAGIFTPSLEVTDSAGAVAFGHGRPISVTATVPAGLASLQVNPVAATVAIGTSQPYQVEGYDNTGHDLGDVTAATTFSISSGGRCRGAACAGNKTNAYNVTATAGTVTGSANLTVTAGSVQALLVNPNGARTMAGTAKAFNASGVDAAGNPTGAVTSATFTIAPDGSCSTNSCVATRPGPHTVTVTYGTASATVSLNVDIARVSGSTPASTSVAASQMAFPASGSAKAAVIAADTSGAEALAGEPLLATKSGPLLLTPSTGLDPGVRAEIVRALPAGASLYLVGPLDASVASTLQAQGYQTVSLQGSTPAATAVAVADSGLGNPSTILEVDQTNLALAAAAGPAAAAVHGAILLTNGTAQSQETASYLSAHPGVRLIAIGSNAASADPAAQPISGTDPTTVAEEVAFDFFTNVTHATVANSADMTDQVLAGALGALGGSPLLLAGPLPPLTGPTAAYISANATTIAFFEVVGTSTDVARSTMIALQTAIT